MNKKELMAKVHKEKEKEQSKLANLATLAAPVMESVSNTVFVGVVEPVGNGGLRVYIPKIAALNAGIVPGEAAEFSISAVKKKGAEA